MVKIERYTLKQLAEVKPVLSCEEELELIGGGDGTPTNPYTYSEFDTLYDVGSWYGGYVQGLGYVLGFSSGSNITIVGSDRHKQSDNGVPYYLDPGTGDNSYGTGDYWTKQNGNDSSNNTSSGTSSNNSNGSDSSSSINFGPYQDLVLSSIQENIKSILKDRGKYLPRNEVENMSMVIDVKLPVGCVETTSNALRNIAKGTKALGLVGLGCTIMDIKKDWDSGDKETATIKAVITLAEVVAADAGPGGILVSFGIGIAASYYGY